MKKFKYIKSLLSPFKPFKLKLYVGKVALGTPYFLPRRWVDGEPGYKKAIPRKIGFDFVSLGWKTKYDSFRFEYAPLISFVLFKRQLAIIIKAPHQEQYWESWLYYELETDKTKSKKERIKECREKSPQIWTKYSNNGNITTDYYDLILKKKYLQKDYELEGEKMNLL